MLNTLNLLTFILLCTVLGIRSSRDVFSFDLSEIFSYVNAVFKLSIETPATADPSSPENANGKVTTDCIKCKL